MDFFKNNTIFDFMKRRFLFLGLSIFLLLSSLGLLLTKGLNFGIDFTGGTIIQVKYDKKAPIDDIRDLLNKSGKYTNISVTEFGSDSEIIIKTSLVSNSISTDIGDNVRQTLKSTGNLDIRRVDIVGPKVGNALKEKGLTALTLALLVILIYVSFRFEYKFAIASVLALIHDVGITLGLLSLLSIDINLDILAAILTIIGYSLNDTIIVFDRIRESIHDSKENILNELINNSVSKTLSRTTLTSVTTFFVVFTLFIFGGEIIHGFALTLLIGIIVGTYSSIFIAANFLTIFNFSIKDYRNNLYEKEKRRKEKERLRAQFENGRV